MELRELELEKPQSNSILFQEIRKRYEDVRHSLIPMRLRFSKADKAVFVKLRLRKRPFGYIIAGSTDAPSVPPKEEVISGNYNYDPCPRDEPPTDSRTLFHYFYSVASKHPDVLWGPRLPRKLGPGLTTMDDTEMGWYLSRGRLWLIALRRRELHFSTTPMWNSCWNLLLEDGRYANGCWDWRLAHCNPDDGCDYSILLLVAKLSH